MLSSAVRALVVLALSLVALPSLAAPALADDEGSVGFRVIRGGQTFERTTFATELAPDGRLMRAGSFLVKYRPEASSLARDNAGRAAGSLAIERLLSADRVRLQVGRLRTRAALLVLRADPAIETVEPDYVATAMFTPNDPRFGEQWGMTKINAPAAWDTSTGAGARVAVVDCGVYSESSSTYVSPDGHVGHPDLRGKVIGNKNFTSAPNADDYCNHGTHVAGIAGANTNNSVGVAGVAFGASILNVKVLGDNGSGSFSWIINGVLYAAGCDTSPCGSRRADIINMSLGATGSCTASMQSAIDKAWAQGLVIVAAAGNNGATGAITPANCNHVIGVAASDQNDARASFSNFGSGVDVAAPGVGILSSDYVGGYASFSGTSMASPHVAGLAALVWNGDNAAVTDCITASAKAGAKAGSTYGRVDAAAAVANSCQPAPVAPALSIADASADEGNAGATTMTFTVTRAGDTTGESSVHYATSNGSATAGSDYTAASGDLTFPSGAITRTVAVSVTPDTTAEPDETFTVTLSLAANATLADPQATGTIRNDDVPAVAMTIDDVSLKEPDSGTKTFRFTVELSATSSQTVTVAYATANGTATGGGTCGSGTDYRSEAGTLTFNPGATSRTITIAVCGDRARESDETFVVNLTDATNASISDASGTGTIRNDD